MKKAISVLFLILVMVTFAGCQQNTIAEKNEKIVIYLSGPEAMLEKLETEFENEYGDVCEFLVMSCGQVKSKVWAEKEAGKIQADIIWGSDPAVYNVLSDEGVLEEIKIHNKSDLNSQYLTQNNYVLTHERYVTILYNKDKFANGSQPQSFSDLKNEEYADMLVMADANQSATALAIASSLYQMLDQDMDYFSDLHQNGVLLAKSNGQVPSKIMEGEFDLGIGPHDSVIRLKNKAKKEGFPMPVEIVWPTEGVIAINRPMAIIKKDRDTEKSELCQQFVNFILSKKAQQITYGFGFVSVRNDIENGYLPDNATIFQVDWKSAIENEDQFKQDYQEIFK